MLATLVAYGLSAQLHEDDNSLIHPGIFVHYSLFFQLSISTKYLRRGKNNGQATRNLKIPQPIGSLFRELQTVPINTSKC